MGSLAIFCVISLIVMSLFIYIEKQYTDYDHETTFMLFIAAGGITSVVVFVVSLILFIFMGVSWLSGLL